MQAFLNCGQWSFFVASWGTFHGLIYEAIFNVVFVDRDSVLNIGFKYQKLPSPALRQLLIKMLRFALTA